MSLKRMSMKHSTNKCNILSAPTYKSQINNEQEVPNYSTNALDVIKKYMLLHYQTWTRY